MKKISTIKYMLLMLIIGVALGVVVFVFNLLLESFSVSLPNFVLGGGVIGAGMVFSMITINKSIRNGGYKWLQKKKPETK